MDHIWLPDDYLRVMNLGLLLLGLIALEESLSITTARCDLAIATHARKMHKKNLCGCPPGGFG